jgi:L-aspartate oxidase
MTTDRVITDGQHRIPVRRAPAVVIGSGVAGLSTALALDHCIIISETDLGDGGSSRWAQGGVAAAVGAGDSPAAHAADTVAVSGGLADPEVALAVTSGGARMIAELIERGAGFDRSPDGSLALGREAGHSARRIVHADGDATGAEIVATLVAAVRDRAGGPEPGIELWERSTMVDLIRSVDGVTGVLVVHADGRAEVVLSGAVVLATGGYAHCYARTTTPRQVIGSGVVAAARVGAALADLEFVQFHPTALDVPGAGQLPLLTEALRGEGAVLVDETGGRYCLAAHPDGELAPRDVVARANYRSVAAGHRPALDARAAIGDTFPERFPTVFGLATANGFDPRTEPLPITPAAHYCMGGVLVDQRGRTSVPGLWAVGEVTSSGLHGANRLASNSLLEGLVLARAAAADIMAGAWRTPRVEVRSEIQIPADSRGLVAGSPVAGSLVAGSSVAGSLVAGSGADRADIDRSASAVRARGGPARVGDVEDELRRILWEHAGVERTAAGLAEGRRRLAELADRAAGDLRIRTIHTVATLVIEAARDRTESRGAHFRADHPDPAPAGAERSVIIPAPATGQGWLVEELVPAVSGS